MLGADYAGVLQARRLGAVSAIRPRGASNVSGPSAPSLSHDDAGLDATNWRAEHALRPAVITRKMCGGGNRTVRGAQTQQVLASILRTAQQRGLDTTETLTRLLQAPKPVVLDAFQSAPLH
jgi:transposase